MTVSNFINNADLSSNLKTKLYEFLYFKKFNNLLIKNVLNKPKVRKNNFLMLSYFFFNFKNILFVQQTNVNKSYTHWPNNCTLVSGTYFLQIRKVWEDLFFFSTKKLYFNRALQAYILLWRVKKKIKKQYLSSFDFKNKDKNCFYFNIFNFRTNACKFKFNYFSKKFFNFFKINLKNNIINYKIKIFILLQKFKRFLKVPDWFWPFKKNPKFKWQYTGKGIPVYWNPKFITKNWLQSIFLTNIKYFEREKIKVNRWRWNIILKKKRKKSWKIFYNFKKIKGYNHTFNKKFFICAFYSRQEQAKKRKLRKASTSVSIRKNRTTLNRFTQPRFLFWWSLNKRQYFLRKIKKVFKKVKKLFFSKYRYRFYNIVYRRKNMLLKNNKHKKFVFLKLNSFLKKKKYVFVPSLFKKINKKTFFLSTSKNFLKLGKQKNIFESSSKITSNNNKNFSFKLNIALKDKKNSVKNFFTKKLFSKNSFFYIPVCCSSLGFEKSNRVTFNNFSSKIFFSTAKSLVTDKKILFTNLKKKNKIGSSIKKNHLRNNKYKHFLNLFKKLKGLKKVFFFLKKKNFLNRREKIFYFTTCKRIFCLLGKEFIFWFLKKKFNFIFFKNFWNKVKLTWSFLKVKNFFFNFTKIFFLKLSKQSKNFLLFKDYKILLNLRLSYLFFFLKKIYVKDKRKYKLFARSFVRSAYFKAKQNSNLLKKANLRFLAAKKAKILSKIFFLTLALRLRNKLRLKFKKLYRKTLIKIYYFLLFSAYLPRYKNFSNKNFIFPLLKKLLTFSKNYSLTYKRNKICYLVNSCNFFLPFFLYYKNFFIKPFSANTIIKKNKIFLTSLVKNKTLNFYFKKNYVFKSLNKKCNLNYKLTRGFYKSYLIFDKFLYFNYDCSGKKNISKKFLFLKIVRKIKNFFLVLKKKFKLSSLLSQKFISNNSLKKICSPVLLNYYITLKKKFFFFFKKNNVRVNFYSRIVNNLVKNKNFLLIAKVKSTFFKKNYLLPKKKKITRLAFKIVKASALRKRLSVFFLQCYKYITFKKVINAKLTKKKIFYIKFLFTRIFKKINTNYLKKNFYTRSLKKSVFKLSKNLRKKKINFNSSLLLNKLKYVTLQFTDLKKKIIFVSNKLILRQVQNLILNKTRFFFKVRSSFKKLHFLNKAFLKKIDKSNFRYSEKYYRKCNKRKFIATVKKLNFFKFSFLNKAIRLFAFGKIKFLFFKKLLTFFLKPYFFYENNAILNKTKTQANKLLLATFIKNNFKWSSNLLATKKQKVSSSQLKTVFKLSNFLILKKKLLSNKNYTLAPIKKNVGYAFYNFYRFSTLLNLKSFFNKKKKYFSYFKGNSYSPKINWKIFCKKVNSRLKNKSNLNFFFLFRPRKLFLTTVKAFKLSICKKIDNAVNNFFNNNKSFYYSCAKNLALFFSLRKKNKYKSAKFFSFLKQNYLLSGTTNNYFLSKSSFFRQKKIINYSNRKFKLKLRSTLFSWLKNTKKVGKKIKKNLKKQRYSFIAFSHRLNIFKNTSFAGNKKNQFLFLSNFSLSTYIYTASWLRFFESNILANRKNKKLTWFLVKIRKYHNWSKKLKRSFSKKLQILQYWKKLYSFRRSYSLVKEISSVSSKKFFKISFFNKKFASRLNTILLGLKVTRDLDSCNNLIKTNHIFINSKLCQKNTQKLAILDTISFSRLAQKWIKFLIKIFSMKKLSSFKKIPKVEFILKPIKRYGKVVNTFFWYEANWRIFTVVVVNYFYSKGSKQESFWKPSLSTVKWFLNTCK